MSEETKYELVKFIDNELELEVSVSPKEETIWMSQEQIVKLFNTSKQNISLHISNILKSGELEYSTVKENLTVQYEGERKIKRKIKLYNLEMIISVGYRVNSKRGIEFRRWANKVLKEYLLTGYVINEERSLVTNENYVRLINKVESLDERVSNIEKEYKVVGIINDYNQKCITPSPDYFTYNNLEYNNYTYIKF